MPREPFETPSPFYTAMYAGWRRSMVIEGGTDMYRRSANGQDDDPLETESNVIGDFDASTFLPRYPNEEDEDFNWRVKQIFVNPIFPEMVSGMTARIMSEEPGYSGPLEQEESILNNLDLRSGSLAAVARTGVKQLLSRGKTGVLVEHPPNPAKKEGRQPSLEDELEANLRPYIEVIHPQSLIGATTESWGGHQIYSSIRIQDTRHTEDPVNFSQKTVRRIRIYRRAEAGVTLQINERELGENSAWQIGGEKALLNATGQPLRRIPYETALADPVGFEQSLHPLDAVVWKNIEYQHQAANMRHFMSIITHPQMKITNLDTIMDDEELSRIRSPRAILQGTLSRDSQGGQPISVDFDWISAPAGGWEMAVGDLRHILDEAEIAGIRLLVKRPRAQTATAEVLDDLTETSPLEEIAEAEESMLTRAMGHIAAWRGDQSGDGGEVTLAKELTILSDDEDAMQFLTQARKNSDLDRRTLLEEAQKRGRLRQDQDIDEILERLDEEELGARDPFMSADQLEEGDDDESASGSRGGGAPIRIPGQAARSGN